MDENDFEADEVLDKVVEWLNAGNRFPLPEHDAAIDDLARYIGKSPEFTRALSAWAVGESEKWFADQRRWWQKPRRRRGTHK